MPKSTGRHTIIPITEDVIAEGMRRDSIYCPIAEAIRRALPHLTAIRVDMRTIRWSDPAKALRYIWLTPISAAQMIVDIDRGYGTDRIKPFKMRLRDVHIVKMRTEDQRRERREYRASGGKRAKPTRPTIKLKDKSTTEVSGGQPQPIGDPALPANRRIYGARQLTP